MLLFDNVFFEEEFVVFNCCIKECLMNSSELIFCCELKFDGFVVLIIYCDGVLV